jgi:EAL and modified HD-GYP domain-containing signal transduction protein
MRCRVAGFELLHRQKGATEAHVTDDALATDDVIRLVYDRSDMRCHALEKLSGFVNVDAEMLFSSRIESLPAGRVMIELLETVEVDERIILRCNELKGRGYGIALDDFCGFRPDLVPMLDVADIVKVDVAQIGGNSLIDLVAKLRRFPPLLLAEKVDSLQCAEQCRDLHFDFFQGYYFDRPSPATDGTQSLHARLT